MILQTANDKNPGWFCCLVRGIGKANQIVKLPAPPVERYSHTLMWSPMGELAIMDHLVVSTVAVHVLRNNQWTKIAEASQPREAGQIFDHRLSFTAEGVPIVTWQDFFPR